MHLRGKRVIELNDGKHCTCPTMSVLLFKIEQMRSCRADAHNRFNNHHENSHDIKVHKTVLNRTNTIDDDENLQHNHPISNTHISRHADQASASHIIDQFGSMARVPDDKFDDNSDASVVQTDGQTSHVDSN